MTRTRAISSEAMRTWLAGHEHAISLGMGVGQLDRNKAQAFRLELARRRA